MNKKVKAEYIEQQKKQTFFEDNSIIMGEWKDMPEFINDDQKIFKELIIKFRNKNDYDDFAAKIDHDLNLNTKTIWYPALLNNNFKNQRYTDES